MKAADQKAKRERTERAQKLLDGFVGMKVLSKFMDCVIVGPGAAENLQKIGDYATKLLREEGEEFAAFQVLVIHKDPADKLLQLRAMERGR